MPEIGHILSHYRILDKIGGGGVEVVSAKTLPNFGISLPVSCYAWRICSFGCIFWPGFRSSSGRVRRFYRR